MNITWTKTSDRLPDDDTTVLMAMADGEVWVGYMDEGAWRYASADPCGIEVTHWADFPEHPENAELSGRPLADGPA